MPSALLTTDLIVLSRRVLCSVIEPQESVPCQVITIPVDKSVFEVLVEIVNAHEEFAIIQHN